ncbi:MAG: carboxypeptidase M32 [Pirellula sp.]
MNTDLLKSVIEHAKEISVLSGTMALLEWDQHTYMPERAGEFRSQQITWLSGLIHQRHTNPVYGESLRELQRGLDEQSACSPEAANIRGLLRDYEKNVQLPESLVKATALATSTGQQVWVEAKAKDDFAMFKPCLEEIVRLRREEASILQTPGRTKYDSLIDQYEEGADSEQIRVVFEALRRDLVPIVRESIAREKAKPTKLSLGKAFPIESQRRLSQWVAQKIGFDFERGRLDETEHPFCTTLGPHDHRILTRYFEDSYSSGLYGVLHEAGHGLYEQGTPADMHGLPAGSAASLGVHESQSRLWENMVGRSVGFWKWLLPTAQTYLPALAGLSVEQIVSDLNRVEQSLIRIEADEATYNLHIFVRFEIEKELIDGDLKVSDLPELWRSRYQEYLGIAPDTDTMGVMQDVHWSAGLIGYFPTYTLGNLYAAQLMETATRQLGDLDTMFAQGEFGPLLDWLKTNVHTKGRSMLPHELMLQVNGAPLDAKPFLSYLQRKLLSK